MNILSDEELCDFIFGLTDAAETARISRRLSGCSASRLKLQQLELRFAGLGLVQEHYQSPLIDFKKKVLRLSAVAVMAFGAVAIFMNSSVSDKHVLAGHSVDPQSHYSQIDQSGACSTIHCHRQDSASLRMQPGDERGTSPWLEVALLGTRFPVD